MIDIAYIKQILKVEHNKDLAKILWPTSAPAIRALNVHKIASGEKKTISLEHLKLLRGKGVDLNKIILED